MEELKTKLDVMEKTGDYKEQKDSIIFAIQQIYKQMINKHNLEDGLQRGAEIIAESVL